MSYGIRSEATNTLAGYLSTHPEPEMDFSDAEQWRQAAADEIKARRLGVVKALSDDVLQAIVSGKLDMPSIYASLPDQKSKCL